MSIKQCQKCKKNKPINDFTYQADKSDKLCSLCKECSRTASKQYYEQNKLKEIERKSLHRTIKRIEAQKWVLDFLKEHPCAVCGETDPSVLQFDHLRDKESTISHYLVQGNLTKLKEEILKCQVLCANDHARKTAQDQNWYTIKTLEELEKLKYETLQSLLSISPKMGRKTRRLSSST